MLAAQYGQERIARLKKTKNKSVRIRCWTTGWCLWQQHMDQWYRGGRRQDGGDIQQCAFKQLYNIIANVPATEGGRVGGREGWCVCPCVCKAHGSKSPPNSLLKSHLLFWHVTQHPAASLYKPAHRKRNKKCMFVFGFFPLCSMNKRMFSTAVKIRGTLIFFELACKLVENLKPADVASEGREKRVITLVITAVYHSQMSQLFKWHGKHLVGRLRATGSCIHTVIKQPAGRLQTAATQRLNTATLTIDDRCGTLKTITAAFQPTFTCISVTPIRQYCWLHRYF